MYNIAWILNITSNFLVSDLYPDYIDNVINKFDEMKEYTLKFFSLNPSHAKEILDNTVNWTSNTLDAINNYNIEIANPVNKLYWKSNFNNSYKET